MKNFIWHADVLTDKYFYRIQLLESVGYTGCRAMSGTSCLSRCFTQLRLLLSKPGEVKYFVRPVGIKIDKVNNISLDSIGVSFGIMPGKIYKSFQEFNDYYYLDITDFTNQKTLGQV